MNIIRAIFNNIISGIKSALFQKIIRRDPVIIKDVDKNLLAGKTAMITGGNSGIGFAIAKKFVDSGFKVVI